jgi:hypothetical protein
LTNDFSVFIYVNLLIYPPIYSGIIYKGNGDLNVQDGWLIRVQSNGKVIFNMGDGSTNLGGMTIINNIPTQNFLFLGVVAKRDTGYYAYVNGSQTGFVAKDTTGYTVRGTNLQVGKDWASGKYFSNMMASQVLLYMRALSSSEVQWNYQNPDYPVRNGLVLWLKADPAYVKDIDGDGRLEWVDLSGFGNHGKIYGAQLVQLIKTPARV